MKTWQEQIPGCFAGMAAPFGQHPKDAERAALMLTTMQEQGVTWVEVEEAIRAYLLKQGITQEAVAKQMQRVEEKLRAWLC